MVYALRTVAERSRQHARARQQERRQRDLGGEQREAQARAGGRRLSSNACTQIDQGPKNITISGWNLV
jgi:hypothetical protein